MQNDPMVVTAKEGHGVADVKGHVVTMATKLRDVDIVATMDKFKVNKRVHVTNPKQLFGTFSHGDVQRSLDEVSVWGSPHTKAVGLI